MPRLTKKTTLKKRAPRGSAKAKRGPGRPPKSETLLSRTRNTARKTTRGKTTRGKARK